MNGISPKNTYRGRGICLITPACARRGKEPPAVGISPNPPSRDRPPSKVPLQARRVTLDRREAEAEAQTHLHPGSPPAISAPLAFNLGAHPGLFPWLAMRGQMPTCIPGMVYVRH